MKIQFVLKDIMIWQIGLEEETSKCRSYGKGRHKSDLKIIVA